MPHYPEAVLGRGLDEDVLGFADRRGDEHRSACASQVNGVVSCRKRKVLQGRTHTSSSSPYLCFKCISDSCRAASIGPRVTCVDDGLEHSLHDDSGHGVRGVCQLAVHSKEHGVELVDAGYLSGLGAQTEAAWNRRQIKRLHPAR